MSILVMVYTLMRDVVHIYILYHLFVILRHFR